jgi:RNA polymerase primary sigma factor
MLHFEGLCRRVAPPYHVPTAVLALDDKYDESKKLIDVGKEKGYLTYDEVNDLIPHDVHSPEDLDDLLTTIGTQGIDVLEGPKLPSSALTRSSTTIEVGEDVELDLTPGALEKTNDPVRMYLREMGTVPLADARRRSGNRQAHRARAAARAEGAVAFAHRDSRIIAIGEDLKRGVRSIKEVVTFDEEEITEEVVTNRLKEMTGKIDELHRHYKKSIQLLEKLAGIPQKKRPRDYRAAAGPWPASRSWSRASCASWASPTTSASA